MTSFLSRRAPAARALSVVLGCATLAVLSSPGRAAADVPSIDTRTWRPSTDPNASMVIEPAVTPGPGVLSVGAWASYAYRPIALRRAGTDDVALRPIEHRVGLDAVANLGIGQRFAVGALVPLVLFQDGSRGLPPSVSTVPRVPTTAIGDIGLSMKGALVRNEGGGFGLAALGYVSLPTGDRASFAGEGSTTVTARLLAEYTLLVAVAQASLGYRLRTEHRTWPSEEAGGYRFGDELPWTLGLAVRPGVFGIDPGNRQRLEVAAHGWLPAGPVGPFGAGDRGSAALSPALLAVSDRIEIGRYRDAFVVAGAEIGLNSAVGVPAVRFVAGLGWAPREHDMDHDGVKDDLDGCPEIPEDRDGFEDSDGCPEIDNDDDGVIDKEDRCPNVPGEESTDRSRNGCPAAAARREDPDGDGDGIPDAQDKCPTVPEDKDGFQDDDGCPDPDNDGDGIADKEDACRDEKGEPSSDPSRHGCASRDRDGDTFENDADKCPDQAEVWNGVDDADGCPDEGGAALVTVDDARNVRLAKPIQLTGAPDAPDVAPASIPFVRALATELAKHPDWTLAIGAKPGAGDPPQAQLTALSRSFAIVRELSSLTRRDGIAETVGWDAVAKRPGAESGIAFLVLVTPKTTTTAPAPAPAPLPRVP